jgi:hypothetical protein
MISLVSCRFIARPTSPPDRRERCGRVEGEAILLR